jgi:GNAT superfamily N-acetyltransferase
MHIWQYSLRDFTGVMISRSPDPTWEGEFEHKAVESLAAAGRDRTVEAFGPDLKWQLHKVAGGDLIVTITEGVPIAAMVGGVVAVAPSYRKQGIAAELLLRAWADKPWSPGTVLTTTTGQRLLRTAYRRAVFQAMESGAPVSPVNLRDAQFQIRDLVHFARPMRKVIAILGAAAIVGAGVGAAGVWFLSIPDVLNAIFSMLFVYAGVSGGLSAFKTPASTPLRILLAGILALPGLGYFAASFGASYAKYAMGI